MMKKTLKRLSETQGEEKGSENVKQKMKIV